METLNIPDSSPNIAQSALSWLKLDQPTSALFYQFAKRYNTQIRKEWKDLSLIIPETLWAFIKECSRWIIVENTEDSKRTFLSRYFGVDFSKKMSSWIRVSPSTAGVTVNSAWWISLSTDAVERILSINVSTPLNWFKSKLIWKIQKAENAPKYIKEELIKWTNSLTIWDIDEEWANLSNLWRRKEWKLSNDAVFVLAKLLEN